MLGNGFIYLFTVAFQVVGFVCCLGCDFKNVCVCVCLSVF